MNAKDVTFLEDTFKKFYFEHFDLLHVPDNPNQREFGYQKFNGGMNRHISLKSDKDLHLLLMQNKPSEFTALMHDICFLICRWLKKIGKTLR